MSAALHTAHTHMHTHTPLHTSCADPSHLVSLDGFVGHIENTAREDQKLSVIPKDEKGFNSPYDEVKMGPYSGDSIQNSHSICKFTAEPQYEECRVGVTSSDVAMEDNPAYQSADSQN